MDGISLQHRRRFDGTETYAACAKHGHRFTRANFRRVQHRTSTGQHGTAYDAAHICRMVFSTLGRTRSFVREAE